MCPLRVAWDGDVLMLNHFSIFERFALFFGVVVVVCVWEGVRVNRL